MWAHHVSVEEEHQAAAQQPSSRSSAVPLSDSVRLVQAEKFRDRSELKEKDKSS